MTKKTPAPRAILSARVSEDSAEGWHSFCDKNGVSLSAIIEVTGLELLNEQSPPIEPMRQRLVAEARTIDIQRRTRRKT